MNTIMSVKKIRTNLNKIISSINELSGILFAIKKTRHSKLFVKYNNLEKNIDQYKDDLVMFFRLNEEDFLSYNLENKNRTIDIMQSFISNTNNFLTNTFDIENIKSLKGFITEIFDDVIFLSETDLSFVTGGKGINISTKNSKLMLAAYSKKDINLVLNLITKSIPSEFTKDILPYIRIGITDDIEEKIKKKFDSAFNDNFKILIKEINKLATSEIKEIMDLNKENICNDFNIIKNFSVLRRSTKEIKLNKTLFQMTIKDTFLTVKYDYFVKSEDKIVVILNEELLKEIKDTLDFLNTYKYINVLSKFKKDYNDIKSVYTKEVETMFEKNKFYTVMSQTDINNKMKIQLCDFKERFIKINNNITIPFQLLMDNYNEAIARINNSKNNIVKNIYNKCMKEKEEFEAICDDFTGQCIIGLIKEFPKKGITTYVSILFGDNNNKMKQNGYDKTKYYGKLNNLKKVAIEEKIRALININIIIESNYKASFGQYTGLTLPNNYKISNENIKKIENNLVEKDRSSFNIKDFIAELKILNDKKTFIENVKIINFRHEDINSIVSFIINDRSVYRNEEKLLITKLSSIIPKKYAAIFLMNSNIQKGVVSKTLKNISDELKGNLKNG